MKVFREGLARKVGHDLTIEVTSWRASVNVDEEDPTKSSITGSADVGSFQVLEGVGGVKPLSEDDKTDIKKNITKKVLNRSPEITFSSTGVRTSGESNATVTGELTIGGTTQPVDLQLSQEGSRVKGTMTVQQTKWGIKPFSAMMGALKVRDTVEIEIEATTPTG